MYLNLTVAKFFRKKTMDQTIFVFIFFVILLVWCMEDFPSLLTSTYYMKLINKNLHDNVVARCFTFVNVFKREQLASLIYFISDNQNTNQPFVFVKYISQWNTLLYVGSNRNFGRFHVFFSHKVYISVELNKQQK